MLFEDFYAKEWVQVSTAFAYFALILMIPFIYWRASQRLKGDTRSKFIECAAEIYSVVLFLLIAPVGYLTLYFLGSKSKFMLNDPMAWVCFLGAASSIYDLVRARLALNSTKASNSCNKRIDNILVLKRLTNLVRYLSLIPLCYGIIMVGVTNLTDIASIHSMLWFITFLTTGLSVTYAVASRSLLLISQAYASNLKFGCKES